MLHLGGGNAAKIAFDLPGNVRIAPNDNGSTGDTRLWDYRFDPVFGRAKSTKGRQMARE